MSPRNTGNRRSKTASASVAVTRGTKAMQTRASPPPIGSRPLRIAIPNKGRLSEETVDLLGRAGITLEGSSDRKLFASALGGRLQVLFVRAHDIPGFVEEGTVDCGITGLDAVHEAAAKVDVRLALGYGKCRLVFAVPVDAAIANASQVPAGFRIATTYPNLTRRHFARRKVRIVQVSGACEVAPTLGVADAITDITSTGSTLAMNRLREVETILDSECVVVSSPGLSSAHEQEMERLLFALESVLKARGKRYLMADLPRKALPEAESFLPGIAGPTVVEIGGRPDWVAIQVVIDEAQVFDAVHRLKGIGGTGILIVPIDRLIP